jgi:hypothetical protein
MRIKYYRRGMIDGRGTACFFEFEVDKLTMVDNYWDTI